jgi:hypothetical protein
MERNTCLFLTRAFVWIKIRNDERGGRAALVYLDDDANNSEFWTTLGGQIEVTNPGEDDAVVEEVVAQKKLFKVYILKIKNTHNFSFLFRLLLSVYILY